MFPYTKCGLERAVRSLALSVALSPRASTTFLLQLPFLTSAALTRFLLTVVRNLFRFSLMKYSPEAPGPELLCVFFVIPWLSLCFQFLRLLFDRGAAAFRANICSALIQSVRIRRTRQRTNGWMAAAMSPPTEHRCGIKTTGVCHIEHPGCF